MTVMAQEYDAAGPLDVEQIPWAVESQRRRVLEQSRTGVDEFTARDDFANVVAGLIGVCAAIMMGVPPEMIEMEAPEVMALISNDVGVGPSSVGYRIADLAEVMLSDPLDQIPTL